MKRRPERPFFVSPLPAPCGLTDKVAGKPRHKQVSFKIILDLAQADL
ncbi:hypothetical protein BV133_2742 [Blastochloris viridis]|uniref:Uncharacterized protein n=1 Tax=Blastochloris viridis TaxID=1079 RepID=A0A182D4H9_BLAVI|nr:hypothetical protein BV133_2742 [Blastochloris viridis]